MNKNKLKLTYSTKIDFDEHLSTLWKEIFTEENIAGLKIRMRINGPKCVNCGIKDSELVTQC